MIIFFDTETSGKCDWQLPSDHPTQPYLAQLAAILFDDKQEEMASINLLIQRDGWSMSPEASECNGITDQLLDSYGIPLVVALSCFSNLCRRATIRAAFNIAFDDMIIHGNGMRIGKCVQTSHSSPFCVMKAMTPICKIPKPEHQLKYNRNDPYKWPKLQEAYLHVFKKEFEGAHDALADVRATAELYFHLKNGTQ